MESYFDTLHKQTSVEGVWPSVSPLEESLTNTFTRDSRSSSLQELLHRDRKALDIERQITISTIEELPTSPSFFSRLRSRLPPSSLRLNDTISNSILLDAQLITLGFSIGIADVATFATYGAFASLQTGNLISSAVAMIDLTKTKYSSSATSTRTSAAQPWHSILVWLLACIVIGQLNNCIGPRRKGWIILNNFLQAGLVFLACALLATTPGQDVLILCLLSFAGGMQVQMARGINISEITTAMAMSAMMDTVSVPKIWTKAAWVTRKQGRRAVFLGVLFLGTVVGGVLVGFVGAWQALLVSAVIKTGVAVSGLVNTGEGPPEKEVLPVVVVVQGEKGSSFWE